MAGTELPLKAIREQIASAVDLVIHQERMKDGSRKVMRVSEVQGMEGDVITLQDILVFQHSGTDQRRVSWLVASRSGCGQNSCRNLRQTVFTCIRRYSARRIRCLSDDIRTFKRI